MENTMEAVKVESPKPQFEKRFKGLLKARESSLAVFRKAKRKLDRANVEIEQASQGCVEAIEDHKLEIKQEEAAAKFLDTTLEESKKQSEMLGKLLGLQ
jgi:hypothetical protein